MEKNIASLVSKKDFYWPHGKVYLATAFAGLTLCSNATSVHFRNVRDLGMPSIRYFREGEEELRDLAGELLGASANCVTIQPNVAYAVSIIAAGMEWGRGDNVVTTDHSYPSVPLPFLHTQGIEVKRAVGSPELMPSQVISNVLELITSRTRIIALEASHYVTGGVYDLASVQQKAHEVGALLLVDYTQTAGVLPIKYGDIRIATTYKWLLGPNGFALMAFSEEALRIIRPHLLGWHAVDPLSFPLTGTFTLKESAQRFEPGGLPWQNVFAALEALRYLRQLQPQAVREHILDLGDQLIIGLEELGLPVLTPADRTQRAGNICLAMRSPLDRRLEQLLRHKCIIAGVGYGRVRFSPYIYNSAQDIQQVLSALYELIRDNVIVTDAQAGEMAIFSED